jgi:hypothetical protein
MNRSKKKQAHRVAEQQATRAMLRCVYKIPGRAHYSYSEVQQLFKQCCSGRANRKRPQLIAEIMKSGRLRRKLRGGQWQLYVCPRRALLTVVGIDPGFRNSAVKLPIRDISFS